MYKLFPEILHRSLILNVLFLQLVTTFLILLVASVKTEYMQCPTNWQYVYHVLTCAEADDFFECHNCVSLHFFLLCPLGGFSCCMSTADTIQRVMIIAGLLASIICFDFSLALMYNVITTKQNTERKVKNWKSIYLYMLERGWKNEKIHNTVNSVICNYI